MSKVSRSFTMSNLRKVRFTIVLNGILGNLCGEITHFSSGKCLKFQKGFRTFFSAKDLCETFERLVPKNYLKPSVANINRPSFFNFGGHKSFSRGH